MKINQILNSLLPLIGLLDSMYLMRIYSSPGICTPSEGYFGLTIDCGAVARSSYAEILAVPVAMIGILYYLSLVFLLNSNIEEKFFVKGYEINFNHIIILILSIATIFSIYLVYLQLFVIFSICWYCMVSALTTFGLLLNNLFAF